LQTTDDTARRSILRVEDKIHLGGDSQVDDRNAVITPLNPDQTDPFLLLAEDWFSTSGFEWHPHRGLETVTLVLDGVLEHGDNVGHSGALVAGDVQWMTAGRGIIHRELAFRNERAHILQLWVNLPGEQKMVETRYQDLRAPLRPVIERNGVRLDVISGHVDDTSGPALNNWPISGTLITLEPNGRLEHLIPAADRAFFYVTSGAVTIDGHDLKVGQIAWSEPVPRAAVSVITVTTGDGDDPSVVMAYSGQPIRQPVAMGGPFVMNSQAEIEQAFRDFHSGKFGDIPRQARLSVQ
jgi:redox-sensitive bicupin YhaK (pirin superfamily)